MLHHPSLASQQALVRSKEASADSARAARLPTLGASAGTGQISGYSDSRTTTLSVSQPLWAFGRIDSAIDYADNDTLAQQATAQATRRELLEDTAVAYANIQGIRERLAVAESNVNNHQALQEQIQRRAQGGWLLQPMSALRRPGCYRHAHRSNRPNRTCVPPNPRCYP